VRLIISIWISYKLVDYLNLFVIPEIRLSPCHFPRSPSLIEAAHHIGITFRLFLISLRLIGSLGPHFCDHGIFLAYFPRERIPFSPNSWIKAGSQRTSKKNARVIIILPQCSKFIRVYQYVPNISFSRIFTGPISIIFRLAVSNHEKKFRADLHRSQFIWSSNHSLELNYRNLLSPSSFLLPVRFPAWTLDSIGCCAKGSSCRIESSAFSFSSLQSIVIPPLMQSIDGSAFCQVNRSSCSVESASSRNDTLCMCPYVFVGIFFPGLLILNLNVAIQILMGKFVGCYLQTFLSRFWIYTVEGEFKEKEIND
jgi:hypothetical protein